jgi:S-adenosylmethionine:tRNA ribosyltransferase-isomerase
VKTSELDYELPEELIAQQPLEPRDRSRLMVLRRQDDSIEHVCFDELPSLLDAGDLLVANDTKVVPARLSARRHTGGRIDGLFLGETETSLWEVLLAKSRRLRIGERLELGAADHGIIIEQSVGPGRWRVRLDPPGDTETVLNAVGLTPLPHYIHREKDDRGADADDRAHYQTVFAVRPGAVAAPTAGLHFTDALLARLAEEKIRRTSLTLHVGLGTFQPVAVDNLEDHEMHTEWFELSEDAVREWERTRAAGGRIVAVGTTSARVLETCADSTGALRPGSGDTNLFIVPPYRFRAVDALITNFHLPRSTLLALVFALAGPDLVRRAYREAIERNYRFYSFGDAMLIL